MPLLHTCRDRKGVSNKGVCYQEGVITMCVIPRGVIPLPHTCRDRRNMVTNGCS